MHAVQQYDALQQHDVRADVQDAVRTRRAQMQAELAAMERERDEMNQRLAAAADPTRLVAAAA